MRVRNLICPINNGGHLGLLNQVNIWHNRKQNKAEIKQGKKDHGKEGASPTRVPFLPPLFQHSDIENIEYSHSNFTYYFTNGLIKFFFFKEQKRNTTGIWNITRKVTKIKNFIMGGKSGVPTSFSFVSCSDLDKAKASWSSSSSCCCCSDLLGGPFKKKEVSKKGKKRWDFL